MAFKVQTGEIKFKNNSSNNPEFESALNIFTDLEAAKKTDQYFDELEEKKQQIIQQISPYTNLVNNCTEQVLNAMNSSISVYSEEKTYQANDFVLYNGKTYRCLIDITSPKIWDPNDWIDTYLADNITQMLNWIEEVDNKFTFKYENLFRYAAPFIMGGQNDEHASIIIKENGDVELKSDGTRRIWFNWWNSTNALPDWIVPGATYKIRYTSEDRAPQKRVPLRIYVYKDGNTSNSSNLVWTEQDTVFKVPINASGILLRLQYDQGDIIDSTVHAELYKLDSENTESILYYDYNPITLPSQIIGWQDFEKVGEHIWMFTASDDDHNTSNGVIDILDASNWSYIKSISHNIGHCNNISYDPDSDSLLVTHHLENDTKIYIYKNVSEWENLNTINYSTASKIIIDLSTISSNDIYYYNNACWGEKRRDGFRYIYVVSDIGKIWTKLNLNISNNYYTTTFDVVWQKKSIVNAVEGIKTAQVIQGITMYNGKIYTSIAHDPFRGAVYTFTHNSIQREIIVVDGTGLVEANEGCMIINNHLYLGCSSWSGATSSPVIVKINLN